MIAKETILRQYKITNQVFNFRLKQQENGILEKGYVYNLGMPSIMLKESGLKNFPIELVASRLVDKSMQREHPFDLSEITDLPIMVQYPLALFVSATVVGAYTVLTELKHTDKYFVVALQEKQNRQSIMVNSIRSVHYRRLLNIVGWINDGLGLYFCPDFNEMWLEPIKKELLSKPQYNSADVRKQLKSAAKIVNNF